MASAPATDRRATDILPRRRVVGYAMGDVANNVAFQMTSLFLMVYMTDIGGISAGIAGAIYGVTKVWAGVTDPFAGNTVGRKETKHGRLRPWLIWVSPFLAISLVALFSTPAALGPMATVAWILLFDAAFQLCYSFVNIPYGSLSAAMTENATDRSRLSGARSIGGAVTGVVLSMILSPQFEDTTADGIRLKFTLATLALAAVALVLYWVCFRNTEEVVPAGKSKVTLRTTLAMVRRNKPLIILCLGAMFLLGGSFTMNAVMMYYARDVVGGAGYFTLLFLLQTLGTILIASVISKVSARFGKRNGYVGLALIAVLGLVVVGLTPTGNLPMALVAFFLYGIGFGGTNAMMFSMQADTVDYGEWETGTRAEGGAYSVLSFVRKVGQGIGGALGEVEPHAAVVVAPEDDRLVARRPVVTINEMYGAGASYVGPRVAEQLGVPYAGLAFSSEDLERASSSNPKVLAEDSTGRTLRWLHSFSWPGMDVNVSAASGDAQVGSNMVSRNIDEVMALVKGFGGVVLGRDATAILGRMRGAVHIRLIGDPQDRIAREVEVHGIDPEVAEQRQVREDRMRPRMSRTLMHWDPTDPGRYHLIIDTSRMSLDESVEEIVAAVRAEREMLALDIGPEDPDATD